jgi:hypothetical protein
MTQVGEIKEQESTSEEIPKQSRLKTMVTLANMVLKNPNAFRKLRVMGPDEERYVRPPRQYEIPAFHEDMRYSTSNEKYLRPTRWCNPREPTVVAMANELGAYELPDIEFAEAAYWFVKTKMAVEFRPFDSAGTTLKIGTGSCYHLANAYVALCRSAGIKARYKNYMMRFRELEANVMVNIDPSMQEMYNASGGAIPEGECEVCIDNTWTVAYVAQNAAASAAAGWPITKFGEDSIGLYFDALPGTVKRFESLPLQLGLTMKVMKWLTPATMERMNVAVHQRLAKGRRTIEAAGGLEAYEQNARMMRELFSAEEVMRITKAKREKGLEFKD